MKKGVKKIKWTGKGEVSATHSKPDTKLTAKGNQFVYFKISEWEEGTTELEKGKNVFWHLQTNRLRETVLKTTKPYNEDYGIKIPKKLCGPYAYYLEASIPSLSDSKKAGLAVGGWCEQKILKSKWSTTNDGEDVGKSHVFSYGNTIHLNLDTEGLNGYTNLIVDIYRKGEDDKPIKVYTSVDVADGEVNLSISDTLSWYGQIKGIKDVEKFYVKVKNPVTKEYIPNSNSETKHATYLQIKKKIEPSPQKPPTNQTPLKVGKLDEYLKNAGHCRFKKIIITKDDKPTLLFDEGKFIRKLNPNDKSIVTEQIHYDLDKWEIRADAKPILEGITKYLLEPPRLPVELGAHTDCRGTAEYNAELSQKRAQSVVDYLIKQGVDSSMISAKGYGETRLINHGEHISEELHQQNRRTVITFKIFQNDALPLVHNVIVPSIKLPKKLKIDINGFTRKGCVNKPDHKNEIKYFHSYKERGTDPLKDGDNSITRPVHSITPSISELMNAFVFENGGINKYHFYLHSCAYYSIAHPKHPTFVINAYPDVNWVGHFRYDYKDAPFFKDIPVQLVTGIRMLRTLEQAIKDYIKPVTILSGKVQEVTDDILGCITDTSDKVSVGLHALHDFSNPKTPTQRIDYTEEYKAMAELYIAEVTIGVYLVELLILYLTKGKGSFGRLRKYRKLAKASKELKEMGFEFMTPQISWSKGTYFEKKEDGRIANISKERIIAYPLIGIQYHKEHKLADLSSESSDNEGVKELLDNYGLNATLKLDFEGTINADYTVTLDSLTGEHSIFEKASNLLSNSEGTYEASEAIVVKGELKVRGVAEKTVTWIPFTVPQHIKIEVNLKAKLGGFISFSRKYGIENRKAYHQDTIKFTGLRGSYTQKIKATRNKNPVFDSNPTSESVPITVFKEYNMTMDKVTAFNF
jgi:outer membrane protein OmpA-like peptidoglycan-associated protein